MAQLMDTPAGPLLCSRINAGSAIRGDVLVSEQGDRLFRIADVQEEFDTSHVFVHLIVAGTGGRWRIRLGRNEPVWRAVGARAGGTL